MESKISEFKPCPFCGKAPEVETIGSCVEIWCCCKVSIQKSDYLTIDERETWDQQRFMFSSAVEKKVLLEAAKQWNVRYLETELAEARAEIERLNNERNKLDSECNGWVRRLKEKEKGFAITLHAKSSEIERKDQLIEQMREALKLALTEARSTHCENTIKAALEAAEREE